jgi:hypothetical protein
MADNETGLTYTEREVDNVISELISTDDSLKHYYQRKLKEDHSDEYTTRLIYLDIAHTSRYVVECVKTGKTDFFDRLFDKIEHIISNCDNHIENLIVVGLFEGIQNVGGHEINYHFGFDKWLRPTSKNKWDNLIDGWEGPEWRKRKNI